MRKINYKSPELFKYRFKRSPKFWSIEELHDLYLRTKERAANRSTISRNIVNRIIEEVIPTETSRSNVTYQVYFSQKTKDKTYLRQYEITTNKSKSIYGSFVIPNLILVKKDLILY